jgi:hypothetical protein
VAQVFAKKEFRAHATKKGNLSEIINQQFFGTSKNNNKKQIEIRESVRVMLAIK